MSTLNIVKVRMMLFKDGWTLTDCVGIYPKKEAGLPLLPEKKDQRH